MEDIRKSENYSSKRTLAVAAAEVMFISVVVGDSGDDCSDAAGVCGVSSGGVESGDGGDGVTIESRVQ